MSSDCYARAKKVAAFVSAVVCALPALVYLGVRLVGNVSSLLGVNLSLSIAWTYFTAAMFASGALSLFSTPVMVVLLLILMIRGAANLSIFFLAAASIVGTVHFLAVYGLVFMKN